MLNSIVYVKKDEGNRIISINSDSFLSDTTGWVQIDEGAGDRYHHAQGNYFPGPLHDNRGIPRYAYVPDGDPKWRERTQEEMDADYVPPEPVPPLEARVGAVEIKTGDLEEALDMILLGVTEPPGQIKKVLDEEALAVLAKYGYTDEGG